jgi:hypothetical protein
MESSASPIIHVAQPSAPRKTAAGFSPPERIMAEVVVPIPRRDFDPTEPPVPAACSGGSAMR